MRAKLASEGRFDATVREGPEIVAPTVHPWDWIVLVLQIWQRPRPWQMGMFRPWKIASKRWRGFLPLLPGIDFTEQLENGNEVEPLLHQHVETLPRNDHHLSNEDHHLSLGFSKLMQNSQLNRFFGKSSGVQLVQTALNFQRELTGVELSQFKCCFIAQKRDEYWMPLPWILPPAGEDNPRHTFPDPDLLVTLVDLYFEEVNPFWPVLHRPIFSCKVADKLHLRDPRFARTLLMVCSLGSRHSNDPRVLLEGVKKDEFHSAGWKWYSQVHAIRKYLICKPDLYELQTIALSALYLQALSPMASCWNEIGFGLRRAQDVGAHRRRNLNHPTVEGELWKRVFWVLLCLDRVIGTLTGRPLAMHDQDFDQDLPIEVDDEYWDLPEPRNFKQPQDQPSDMAYFIYYAKLLEIQAAVTIAIYSPRKPRDLFGHPFPPTDAQCIAAFDSALNSWLSNVPEHLRWDPDRKNKLHLSQSALLHTAYYELQILVHRPFIPTPFETTHSGALPSLTICTSAARSCVRIFDNHVRRGIPVNYNMLPAAFITSIVLLLNAWSGKQSGITHNASKELDLVYSCLRIATEAEKRYLAAGRYTDIMNRLLHAGRVDILFDLCIQPTLPPLAQPYCEGLPHCFDAELSAQWSSTFIRHHVKDFEAAADELYDRLNSRLGMPDRQHLESGSMFPGTDTDCSHQSPGPIYDLEHMNTDTPQFPADMAAVMWSTAPSFQYVFSLFDASSVIESPGNSAEDWSYLMANDPQFNQSSSIPGQTYLGDPKQDEQLNRELCGL
ncbi:fungal-specific transcription factor domain-containing protein [Mycena capillaripes]|nr:fungal-specific transcription factor domain-containing protein [Mycena capillaripes]